VALAALAFIWGYSWVVIKVALRYTEPFVFSAMRAFFAGVVLFAVMVVLRRPLRPKAVRLMIVIGVLQTTAISGLSVWAVKFAGAGETSILVYTMPFWLLLLAWIALGERLQGLQWVAFVLALAGLVLILRPWQFHGGLVGDIMAIVAGLSSAAGAVVVKVLRTRRGIDLLSLTAWQMLFGSVPLIVVAAVTTTRPPAWSGTFIAALLYIVLLGGALAWYLWFFVLHVLPAGIAGIGSLAVPVLGVVGAWIQLGERPALWEGLGMLLIVAALALLTGRGVLRLTTKRAAPALPATASADRTLESSVPEGRSPEN
jgi:drug/metabolite transporter (DMT)-like permease